jgi:hypothetical protein
MLTRVISRVKWMRRLNNWLARRGRYPLTRAGSTARYSTGHNFSKDPSTTKAVERRMALMEYYLRGQDPRESIGR